MKAQQSAAPKALADSFGRPTNIWKTAWPPIVILLATLAVYANTLTAPFVYDDAGSITTNSTIRSLWPLSVPLSPPKGGFTVAGRPLLNASLALNYAIGGLDPLSYHLLNLLIHAGGALLLYGVVRRTLQSPVLARQWKDRSMAFAGVVALLWAIHPLQTEAVTYVIQRAESLMGFWFILAFYTFVRGTQSGYPRRWYGGTIVACLGGMATKEVMAAAPLLLLLYDRAFVSGSFRAALQTRGRWLLGFASTWVLLGFLVLSDGGNRGGSIGFGVGVSAWAHAVTQPGAVLHYLRLVVWPHPLVFEYEPVWIHHVSEMILPMLLIGGLAGLTAVGLVRWPILGFLGALFFAVLAPTSIMPAPTQLISEHRMYLPLAAVLISIAALGWRFFGQCTFVLLACLALPCGALTISRNRVYRSEESLWRDTLVTHPNNPVARYNLATILAQQHRSPEAVVQYEAGLAIQPNMPKAHFNLANVLVELNRPNEAVEHYQAVLALNPQHAQAHYNLANLLRQQGQTDEALLHYREAVKIDPDFLEARDNLGGLLLDSNRLDEAMAQYQEVLKRNPNLVETHCNLGAIYLVRGEALAALREYQTALQLSPHFEPARRGYEASRAAVDHR